MLPFELQDLRLFVRVAETGSFTRAAEEVGMSQSALTRQIQGLEERLGSILFVRTTRSVRLTETGRFWLEQSRPLLQRAGAVWEAFEAQYMDRTPCVDVGVCQTISMAYLPGFFHAFRRRYPEWRVRLRQTAESVLINELEDMTVNVAILTRPKAIPAGCEVVHQFEDGFVVIGPETKSPSPVISDRELARQPLVLLEASTRTGALIRQRLKDSGVVQDPVMEMDNFDLIINAVALGLGYSIVPHRALAIYARSRRFARYNLEVGLSRTLVAIAASGRLRSDHVNAFIGTILF